MIFKADDLVDLLVSRQRGKSLSSHEDAFLSLNPVDRVAYGLCAIAEAIKESAYLLGNGNAATPMGAIEGLGKHISESISAVADAIETASAK